MSHDNILLFYQQILIGLAAGLSSSLINHPFQVLRSRFQNYISIKEKYPFQEPPKILTTDLKVLFKGFSATALGMCCLTVSQSIYQSALLPYSTESSGVNIITFTISPLLGGLNSALLTTPFEGSILRQSKTTNDSHNEGIFKSTYKFYLRYGFLKSYNGFLCIVLRTSIVGSGFAVWMPYISDNLEQIGFSKGVCTAISGVSCGLIFAALSQPAETIRIEQQFIADEGKSLSFRQAVKQLLAKYGFQGIFKGASYRIPRTAPGVFINGYVYESLGKYFRNLNGNNNVKNV
eukprot:gene16856-22343_t